ncbi:MAG: hypothetical protein V7629_16240 [Motiliproteus sp.]
MNLQQLFLSGLVAAAASTAQAVDLKLQAAVGHDSNPFKLANSFDPGSAAFMASKIRLSHDIGDLRLYASLRHRSYESLADEADTTRWNTGGRYKVAHSLWGSKARTSLSLNYGGLDKTYVSRSSGQVGTFSGQRIDDRYDYRQWDAQAKTRVKLSKPLATGLRLKLRGRDYEDYQIAGLSDLDYRQLTLANDWTFRPNKVSEFRGELSLTQREFDDKRQKESSGALLASTDLEYRYYRVELEYQRAFSGDFDAELTYAFEVREDNGPGYYDTDDHRLSLELGYTPGNNEEVSLKLGYQDRKYVNTSTIDESNDGEPSKKGYFGAFEASKRLPKWAGEPLFFAALRYEDYDSSDVVYIYDSAQVSAGVRLLF